MCNWETIDIPQEYISQLMNIISATLLLSITVSEAVIYRHRRYILKWAWNIIEINKYNGILKQNTM